MLQGPRDNALMGASAMQRRHGAGPALIVVGLMWVAAGLTACAPPLDWREVRPSGSTIAAMLPCKPKTSTRTVALAGQPVRLALWACKAGDSTWGLAVAELADPARVGAVLSALAASAVDNVQGRVENSAPAAVKGATPNEASRQVRLAGRKPDGEPIEERFVVFAHGTQVAQATVLAARIDDTAAETFFASLRVRP
jgi:hypothetical protein